MSDTPNAIDWLTLGATILAPVLTARAVIWQVRYKDSDKFNLYIKYVCFERPYEEIPMLYVQNISDRPLDIVSILLVKRSPIRKNLSWEALEYDDPFDLDYPYVIDAHSTRRFRLNENLIKEKVESLDFNSKFLCKLRFLPLLIDVKCSSGIAKSTDATLAAPHDIRPC